MDWLNRFFRKLDLPIPQSILSFLLKIVDVETNSTKGRINLAGAVLILVLFFVTLARDWIIKLVMVWFSKSLPPFYYDLSFGILLVFAFYMLLCVKIIPEKPPQ